MPRDEVDSRLRAAHEEGNTLAPTKKTKSVHYSTMQNKPVSYECLAHLRNRIMFNVDVPRYFCLDLIDTKPVFTTQKPMMVSLSGGRGKAPTLGRLKLTEVEKEHNRRLSDFAFQLEVTEELTTRQVALMFIDHGDVSVVKTGSSSFWVDFESFDSEESICA